MDRDPFKEYIIQTEANLKDKGYIWHTAIGLQAVDGLVPSQYLKQTAIQNIEGKITLDEAQRLLDSYYIENPANNPDDRTEEADKVSVRIAQLLSEQAFSFTPNEYLSIHRKLFRGILNHAGQIRTYNITKKEWILEGASIIYGSATELMATLEYDFSQEKIFNYKGLSMDDIIRHLAFFVSRLWQIHVFSEGNTRTTAVFFIKYLRTLGFNATNEIFAENAWYFRNALVRANYNNLSKGIHETTEFLELFLRNLLLNEHNALHNRTMHISGNFKIPIKQDNVLLKQDDNFQKQDSILQKQDDNTQKQDNILRKQDDNTQKQDIDIAKIYPEELSGLSKKYISHVVKLYTTFGTEYIFSRKDVSNILGITPSPASAFIKKLLEVKIIQPAEGYSKRKYQFVSIQKSEE